MSNSKGHGGDGEQRKINMIPLAEESLTWLTAEANRRGLSIAEFAGALLDEAAINWRPPQPGEIGAGDRSMYWNDLNMRRQMWRRKMVEKAAAMYTEFPTEANAELLAQQCELCGVDYNEALAEAERDPFSAIVAYETNGTKFGECVRWLPRFLYEHGSEVSASVISKVGERLGYTDTMLNRSKRRVNNSTASAWMITSAKVGHGWKWRLLRKDGRAVIAESEHEDELLRAILHEEYSSRAR